MPMSLGNAFIKNFLGKAPDWYKVAIIAFLIMGIRNSVSID
ncbi:Na+/H+ antiporter NhaB [Vibrio cholerae]|nr:Na+/H+ antiporter NhaB [Vibrio cholerae]